MLIERIVVGELDSNCYVVAAHSGGKAAVIDPGADIRVIKRRLEKHKLSAECVINTHGHADHIGCDNEFGLPVYVHMLDRAFLLKPELNMSAALGSPFSVTAEIRELEDNQVITAGGVEMRVIHLPGHTPGGIALLCEDEGRKILFSGDSLFRGSIGRSDLPCGDGDALLESLRERILTLSEDTPVYPGHGESTTIGEEKRKNPFLR
ncbi:MAG: MBL fold metallo-hydrolase [Candidatus Omnitrophota bacterium]|jgi:glyoxylase-like metal-dependent hydrolase (beta-lactamase superfamily II)|nr:MBL fold metallo-hydrolase [Candidatus Omnitrophota bacterium]MDD3983228.1 MBL fold metallo-hydrolase [Candidatus Omnitrophota bacterium]NLE91660.1 MBL fold metallo-hydrolase [Elusimicrobiota bacterium]